MKPPAEGSLLDLPRRRWSPMATIILAILLVLALLLLTKQL